MKTTIKILPLLFGVMLFFTQCEKEVLDKGTAEAMMGLKSSNDCSVTQTLWAGAGQNDINKGTDVGTVTATVVGNTLYVDYDVTEPWYAVEYHLWVGKDIKDIPRNAAPGRFPFSGSASYSLNLDDLGFASGDYIYIAAHAVVAQGDLETLEAMLPEDVDFSWELFTRLTNPVSYFEIDVDEPSWLEGIYEGWCADSYVLVGGNPRSGTAYSSYDVTLPYEFDKPENLPLVNWVINYDFVGKTSSVGGDYTLGDVQRAIWFLLWEEVNPNPIGGVGTSSDARVAEIVEMAGNYGEEYMPGCGDYLVLVIVQDEVEGEIYQPVVIKYPIPCGGEETAWAFGDYAFSENNIARKWGWAFDLNCSFENGTGEEENDNGNNGNNGNNNGNNGRRL